MQILFVLTMMTRTGKSMSLQGLYTATEIALTATAVGAATEAPTAAKVAAGEAGTQKTEEQKQ
jgi:hypothetical protein